MKEYNYNTGTHLIFLLKQQRYLYHQLKDLVNRQQELAGTNSPELLLEVTTGRRKIIEKLKELDGKLRPIRTNWDKVAGQIGHDDKNKVHKMANEMQEMIPEISAGLGEEMVANILPGHKWHFDGLVAER